MEPAERKRAVIYARVSTERQRERHTIASQLSVLPEVVRQHQYVLIDEPYIDDGVSGETIHERPQMMRLLEDAERSLFDAIFVIDLDRLTRARKSLDWEIIKDVCRRHRILVITPAQTYDFANEDHEFISDIFSRISAYEKKKILRRMVRGKWEKTKQGNFVGGRRPYGYRIIEKRFEVHPEEADVIRQMFAWCLEGRSCEAIRDALTAAGYPTPTGRKVPWAKSTVRRILQDEKYTGQFIRWTWKREEPASSKRGSSGRLARRNPSEWVTVEIPALIDRQTYAAAQQGLAVRKTIAKRNSKREYLLSGLLWCATCKCRMTGESYRQDNRYYVCYQRRRKKPGMPPCPLPACSANQLEHTVWDTVVSLLSQPDTLERAIQVARHEAEHNAVSEPERLAKLIQLRQQEKDRLINLYTIGALDSQEITPYLVKVKQEIATLQAQLDAAVTAQRQMSRLSSAKDVWAAAFRACHTMTYSEKRTILKLLFLASSQTHKEKQIGIWCHADGSVELRGIVEFPPSGQTVGMALPFRLAKPWRIPRSAHS
jgi:site-specific DNA recombinase